MPRWSLGIMLLLAACAACTSASWSATRPAAGPPRLEFSAHGGGDEEALAAAGEGITDGVPHDADELAAHEPDDAHEDHDDGEDPEEDIDASVEHAPADGGKPTAARSPLTDLSDADIERMLREDPASIGCLSLGATNAGRLFNGVQMPEGEGWKHLSPAQAWGTQETVDFLIRAITETRRQHPDSPPLYLGHISARNGGPLSPHVSHQAGRDVDISYYLTPQRPGFHRATAKNLDLDRSWGFVRALITETDVEMILIDSGVQKLLKEHALQIGEDPAWIDEVFQVGSRSRRPLIRHARGHANHIHIRFYSPVAQASAARAHGLMAKHGKVQPAVRYIRHVVKNGQTLGILAKRYGVTVESIQRANQLKGTFIKAKRVLNIPHPGGSAGAAGAAGATSAPASPPVLRPPVIPARRLPPEHATSRRRTPAPSPG
ncbi:LysM peptidoglycan-binding domain-containing protein [Chondromyces apiculatus]|uniref:LysM domain-containing protein n=1 Tax=Chondromyces apiculatus DSM 436 TaxID=1192034 RepID=A0A017TDH2_9BACT|nr:penicillin-insensitive murein endopeptidase [Chondromyces apiculatus]EYF06636.1 Hypothetical protein CAP_1766 [Chondromyces apiculatus DSM 436]